MIAGGRRFYIFNDCKTVADHVSKVYSVADLMQLAGDIQASETNLTYFVEGKEGIWEVYCLAGDRPERHLFLTQDAFKQLGALTPDERKAFSSVKVLS